jgi:hypothetical protein
MTEPTYEPPRPRRSLSAWLAILLVWAVGICVWAGYVVMMFVVLVRFFAA